MCKTICWRAIKWLNLDNSIKDQGTISYCIVRFYIIEPKFILTDAAREETLGE
jgi:hypothetical protein